jgi:hypothetical protein
VASELPYLPSYKNVEKLFQKIATAKQPDAFTHKFLNETIGLKSVGDRPLIPLLRTLGFLDASNKPTAAYAELKNPAIARGAMAAAIRNAYEPLFASNERANELSGDALKGLIAQVAGADTGLTTKIAGTFNSLTKLADFSDANTPFLPPDKPAESTKPTNSPTAGLRSEFHYNIQIHLPGNASEETYINIFNALRKTFQ